MASVKMESGKERSNLKNEISLLTAGEVARLLHVHINTVRRWSNLGVLPSFRAGSRRDRQFWKKDILTFLKWTGDEKIDSESHEQTTHNLPDSSRC